MSLESTVGIAKVGTRSLRATVPEGIVVFLGVKVGEKLEWKMDVQNNERVVMVKKGDYLESERTRASASKHVRPSRVKGHV
jgi:hypothetical protein